MASQHNKQITFAEDMTDERQQEVLTLAKEVFLSSHIADSRWCCIVGRNFGSYVTHQMKTYIHFSMFSVHVLLFKP
ncbi:Dynein light chain 1, cytoplasmic [Hondaea fermentalgiana]|uniref:Dynein light chain n=1 Tax=Hondaea fermentalgiana TaxID=2315210 RepID=A0A2R5GM37_9STRA|nr:Dynein light chain 1, cytoplasmic [Hondaea fermentalgiana]|eukprot:GBG31940.1 Dynein light chain 1, cytoplasmic [Hondaea fermentalgiana]